MVEKTVDQMINESIVVSQFYDKQIEMTLKYFENTNPVERILKTIDPADEELRKLTRDKTTGMMNVWLDSYARSLEQSKDLPIDLLGNAADLAKRIRKENSKDIV